MMLPDGWLRTGDIGRMDERGRTFIEDRKKDMILVSGFNVYPNEVEGVVAQMPAVLEVAAVAAARRQVRRGRRALHREEGCSSHRRRGRRLLQARADALQGAEARLLPDRAAEDQRRQDPAPHAARRALARIVHPTLKGGHDWPAFPRRTILTFASGVRPWFHGAREPLESVLTHDQMLGCRCAY